jgi:hypothetical protein
MHNFQKGRSILQSLVGNAASFKVMENWDFSQDFMNLSRDDQATVIRYGKIVTDARMLAKLSNTYYETGKNHTIRENMTGKTNNMLGFMVDNFPATDVPIKHLPALYKPASTQYVITIIPNLDGLASGVVPVSLLRELCHKHKLSVDTRNCPNFEKFMNTYKVVWQTALA